MQQLTLLSAPTSIELDESLSALRRFALSHDAWIEHCPAFVRGHAALFSHLEQRATWRIEARRLYDQDVVTPRLVARAEDPDALHPLVPRIQALLEARYGQRFDRVSLALYRDGNDSVAPHGDQIARELPEALVATVSLGAPRRLRLTAPGESRAFMLGEGDLFVMGGTCQRTWRHGIAKVASAQPRISVMFRPAWRASPAASD